MAFIEYLETSYVQKYQKKQCILGLIILEFKSLVRKLGSLIREDVRVMKKVLIIALLILCAVVVWWKSEYPAASFRYKMTVTLETPEGIKTGSTVREVSVHLTPRVTPEMTPTVRLKGEAVVVDLGERGVVFAVLRGIGVGGEDYGRDIVKYVFPKPGGYRTAGNLQYYSSLLTGPNLLELTYWPMFVRFKDLNEPQTIESLLKLRPVDGTDSKFTIEKDSFEEAFGEGVKLQSVTIEMTKDPVQMGQVPKFLPWFLPRMKSRTMGPIGGTPDKPFEDPSGTYLTSRNFVQGVH